jgi:hypothetical protein
MRRMRPTNAAHRWLLILAILCFVAPLLLQGATLTHTHDRGKPGLYNQEHDFTLYAISGATALPEAAAAIVAIVLAVSVCIAAAPRPRRITCAAADSRAPPAR